MPTYMIAGYDRRAHDGQTWQKKENDHPPAPSGTWVGKKTNQE